MYRDCFTDAETVYWLPTYLSREDPDLTVLTPEELTADINNSNAVRIAEMDDDLWTQIELHRHSDELVLGMGAGSIDGWLRERLND